MSPTMSQVTVAVGGGEDQILKSFLQHTKRHSPALKVLQYALCRAFAVRPIVERVPAGTSCAVIGCS